MVQFIPARNEWADIFRNLGEGLTNQYMHQADESAIRNAINNLGPDASARDILNALTNVKTYRNEAKQQALSNFLGVEQFEEVKRRAQEQENLKREKNELASSNLLSPEQRQESIDNLLALGYTLEEADILTNPNITNATKQNLSKRVEEEFARGLRQKPLQVDSVTSPNTQINPTQANESSIEGNLKEKKMDKGLWEWPKLDLPQGVTRKELESWRKNNEKENSKILKDLKQKSGSQEKSIVRLNRLESLNGSKKLPSGIGRLVINPETGEPYALASLAGLVNKETQDFIKTVNDFMIDAKNYFGARVTNFDVQAFKSRLPTLLNTEEGRRVIIQQMRLMEQLQLVHDNALANAIKHYGRNANYIDIQKVADDFASAQEEEIIRKINLLDEASDYLDLMAKKPEKYKDRILIEKGGNFVTTTRDRVQKAIKEGYTVW